MLSFMLKRTVLAFTSICLLTGCMMPSVPQRPVTITGTPEPYPCAHFADANWKEFRFGVDRQDDVIATVGRIWGIGPEEIQSHEPAQFHPLPRLSWEVTADGVRYFAIFYEDGPLKEVDFLTAPYWQEENNRIGLPLTLSEIGSQTGSYPTKGQVISCFGEPDFYTAYWHRDIEDAQLHLALWYVDQGLVFAHRSWGEHHRRPLPPPFPHELSMHFATLLPPGDVARMVNVHYGTDYGGKKKEYVLCVIKPWPGSIEAMEDEIVHLGYVLPPECEGPTPESGVIRPNSERF